MALPNRAGIDHLAFGLSYTSLRINSATSKIMVGTSTAVTTMVCNGKGNSAVRTTNSRLVTRRHAEPDAEGEYSFTKHLSEIARNCGAKVFDAISGDGIDEGDATRVPLTVENNSAVGCIIQRATEANFWVGIQLEVADL